MRAIAHKFLVLLTLFTAIAVSVSAYAKPRKHAAPAPAGTSRRISNFNKANAKHAHPTLSRAPARQAKAHSSTRVATTSTPDPAPARQPQIHVTHDRKQHHSVPPAASSRTTPAAFTRAAVNSKKPTLSPITPQISPEIVKISGTIRPTTAKPLFPSIEDEVIAPVILPSLYDTRGHLVMPPPLRGSREILLHQNQMAEQDGLLRIQDDDDLMRMRTTHMLVPVPVSTAMVLDQRLPANRRYVRPWTADFLVTLARAHSAYFHTPLQVNSAVRTVEFQQKLMHTNGNAAPAEGETASPHLTGQAVDIAKHGLNSAEIAWMRAYLLPLIQNGQIDVEEEFQQACFHISVYKQNSNPEPSYRDLPTTHRGSESSLALAIGSND